MDNSTQKIMDYLIALANERLHPHAIFLFGSRARGDARPNSDYDIAFDFDAKKYASQWGTFCIEAQENAPTLLSIDLVNMNEISTDFTAKIHKEGIVIYKGE